MISKSFCSLAHSVVLWFWKLFEWELGELVLKCGSRREKRGSPAQPFIIYVPVLVTNAHSWLRFLFNPHQKTQVQNLLWGNLFRLKKNVKLHNKFLAVTSCFSLLLFFPAAPGPEFVVLIPGPVIALSLKATPRPLKLICWRTQSWFSLALCAVLHTGQKEAWNSCSVRKIMMNILFSQLWTRAPRLRAMNNMNKINK